METPKNRASVRLLYIEDNAGTAQIFQRRMKRCGYDVDLAQDGPCGIDMITDARQSRYPYDLVAVDYYMPKMNGVEVVKKLASDPDAPPTIMLTGTGDERIAVSALKAGAKDYVVKDVANQFLNLLPAVIEQVLDQERLAAENKKNVEALHQKTVELEERNQELNAFAHTVAHDLQNPVVTILGYVSLVQDFYNQLTEDELKMYLERIGSLSRRVKVIIHEILLMSRLDKEEIDIQPLDMDDLLNSTRLELAHLLMKHQPEICEPDKWDDALGYGPWIQNVWSNYLSNAIKYGGSPAKIELGSDPMENDLIRFWVRDHGPGIPPDKQDRLFVAFTRLNQVSFNGHGLGLSIVRHIMTRLNGRCGLDDTPGGGCTFWFELPAQ